MTTSDHSAQQLARELLGPSWPRVRRIPLIRREIRESLSTSALEMLMRDAELIVEGSRDLADLADSDGQTRGYATVMLTLDLARGAQVLREPADAATAQRVAELMRGSKVVRTLLVALARPELAAMFQIAGDPRAMRVELSPAIRVEGTRILVDGDAVVSLGSTRASDGQASCGGVR